MFLVFLAATLVAVAAQQSGKDPTKDVCRRHKHQTCVIDSKLYIYGGLAYYGTSKDNSSVAEQNTYLLWEDLSKATGNEYEFPVQYSNASIDSNVPLVSGGVLWPDTVNKLFYLFGGEYKDIDILKKQNSQGGFNFWFYDAINDKWEKPRSDGSQAKIQWPALGASAVSDAGKAYYYGGYLTNTSDVETVGSPVMLNALISYDMNTQRWDMDTGNPTRRAEGSLHYLPASDAGMLVYFGGVEMNASSETSYANMSDVQIYDIASSRWYTQRATGDVPQPRRGFCAGAVWAKDQSSYNIYLYGGFDSPNGTGLDDLYVLSMPSFHWISIWPDPQKLSFPGGKGWTSCNVFRESQMLIIGGYQTNLSKTDCDIPAIGGQHAMLLGQENVEQGTPKNPAWWHTPMDNVTGYKVPDQIVARVGGNADGKATATAPENGWSTHDLEVYFGRTFAAKRTATRSIPTTSTSPPTPAPSPASKKTNVGAIVGGVVGGTVALIGIIAGVVFCLRSRRRRKGIQKQNQPPETISTGTNTAPKPLAGASIMQGSTPASPAHSPQDSLPPTSSPWRGEMHMPNSYYQGFVSPQQQTGDWRVQAGYTQPGNYPYHQPYYPPPPEPSLSPAKDSSSYVVNAHELPNVRSPANAAAEMAEGSTPLPGYGSVLHK